MFFLSVEKLETQKKENSAEEREKIKDNVYNLKSLQHLQDCTTTRGFYHLIVACPWCLWSNGWHRQLLILSAPTCICVCCFLFEHSFALCVAAAVCVRIANVASNTVTAWMAALANTNHMNIKFEDLMLKSSKMGKEFFWILATFTQTNAKPDMFVLHWSLAVRVPLDLNEHCSRTICADYSVRCAPFHRRWESWEGHEFLSHSPAPI